MRHPTPTDSAVLACFDDTALSEALGPAPSPRAGHLTAVLASARHHQVTGYVDHALRRIGAGNGSAEEVMVMAWLRSAAAMTAMHQLRVLADLRWIGAVFTAADVPWCVMKGPVLAERVYPAPAMRSSRDLDIVVPAEDFPTAIAALEADGARLLDANWELALRSRLGQLHIQLPYGTTMDLHWHLINAGHVRDALDISMPSVWRDLRTVMVRDQPASTLSVTDTVVHLGLHAALGGACRLRWLNDLRLVIDHEAVDWASVVARARQWRASRLLGVTLVRSARLLGADVPDDVLTALMGSRRYRVTVEALDRLASPLAATRSWTPVQLWPQFIRESWPDTFRAVEARVRRRAGNGLRGHWYGRQRPQVMMASGGDRGRERYLRLVERGELDPQPCVSRPPTCVTHGARIYQ